MPSTAPRPNPHPWNPQQPSPMPSHRYRDVFARVAVPNTDRAWPDRRLTEAPLWVPVDLRDGNQALAEPMDTERKRRMFELLISMGYKEIEVAYSSASQTDFDFVRHLARTELPEDVTVVVFTPARADLIERTFASIEGLPNAMVHLYTATAPTWRDVVLGRTRSELLALVGQAGGLVARLADRHRGRVRFEFSPEVFNLTEPDFVIEVCDSLTELWDACADRPVVHNLPATVEVATPNVYADQIEYMHRNLARREHVILSVHPHNDRGTGVACAELGVLAGAQRVEGCLFGNGERTGNVDLVTLAMNLHAQGVDPMVDFSDIDTVRGIVEDCIRIPVHPRHPYGGELVYTAFSGTHQDAINKGLARHAATAEELGVAPSEAPWAVPYLPIDPADVGRTYEGVIRVNSQSGKGGIAYVLRENYGLELPKAFQPEFSAVVQRAADAHGQELLAQDLWQLFEATYLTPGVTGPWRLSAQSFTEPAPGVHRAELTAVTPDGAEKPLQGTGNGPLSALTDALGAAGLNIDILTYEQHATRPGPDSPGACFVRANVNGRTVWGAGQDTSVLAASVRAVLSAVNQRD